MRAGSQAKSSLHVECGQRTKILSKNQHWDALVMPKVAGSPCNSQEVLSMFSRETVLASQSLRKLRTASCDAWVGLAVGITFCPVSGQLPPQITLCTDSSRL